MTGHSHLVNPIRENRKDRWMNLLFFFLFLFVAGAVTFYLFYHQTIGNENSYHSDMKAYILEMQGLDSGYSFPYPVFFKLSALIHLAVPAELSVAIATLLLNCLGMCILKVVFDRMAKKELEEALGRTKHFQDKQWLGGVILSFLAISLFFVSMLYLPNDMILPGLRFKYLGVFTANPFHNATYMAARPFAIAAFFLFIKLLDCYETGAGIKDYLFFSLSLLLATMTKPSFTIVLVGAAGLIMLYRLVRKKFRNFLPTLWLGLCFLPTFGDLLYQYKGVFVPEEGIEGGLGFCLGEVWGLYCNNYPGAILLAMAFPIMVWLFHYREIKTNTLLRFSLQIYLMSFAMAFFLYEKGFRKPDFNFSWGYMYGIFFGFVGALLMLLHSTATQKKKPLLLVLQWLAYGAHLVCGLYYFYGILGGNMYY